MPKINIKGVIIPNDDKWIYDWFEIEATCPKDVEDAIEEAEGEGLEVVINSTGGDVWAGSEIYTMLMDYKGSVVTKIVGVAASAASIIAMAGEKVMMSPTAEMMIHNVWSMAVGDYRDMEHKAKVLKDYNSTIANAYMIKSGMDKEELLKLMDKETWLTPEKALEYKLIDEIMFMDHTIRLAASTRATLLPPEVINKIRNTIRKESEEEPPTEEKANIEALKAKLALECEL